MQNISIEQGVNIVLEKLFFCYASLDQILKAGRVSVTAVLL